MTSNNITRNTNLLSYTVFHIIIISFVAAYHNKTTEALEELAFIHIPQSGSDYVIDLFNKNFGISFSQRTNDLDIDSWNFDLSMFCSSSSLKQYIPECQQPTSTLSDSSLCATSAPFCQWWNIPPNSITETSTSYFNKPIRFCVIRHPMGRFLHTYYIAQNKTNVFKEDIDATFPYYVANISHELSRKPKDCLYYSNHNCMHINQANYVEPYVDAAYIEKIQEFLELSPLLGQGHTSNSSKLSLSSMSCRELVNYLKPSDIDDTNSCNFPLVFQNLRAQLKVFIRKCFYISTDFEFSHDHIPLAFKNIKHHYSEEVSSIIGDILKQDYDRFAFRKPHTTVESVPVAPEAVDEKLHLVNIPFTDSFSVKEYLSSHSFAKGLEKLESEPFWETSRPKPSLFYDSNTTKYCSKDDTTCPKSHPICEGWNIPPMAFETPLPAALIKPYRLCIIRHPYERAYLNFLVSINVPGVRLTRQDYLDLEPDFRKYLQNQIYRESTLPSSEAVLDGSNNCGNIRLHHYLDGKGPGNKLYINRLEKYFDSKHNKKPCLEFIDLLMKKYSGSDWVTSYGCNVPIRHEKMSAVLRSFLGKCFHQSPETWPQYTPYFDSAEFRITLSTEGELLLRQLYGKDARQLGYRDEFSKNMAHRGNLGTSSY